MKFVAPSIFLVGAIALHGETIQERISGYVRSYADAGLFSGVVLVSKGNAVVYQQAFGLADRALKVPNTVQSKFYIASLSKPITAVGVLRLVEQGKLSLDDHLSKFVPDFPGGDKITIEELLTHYSGLADASADPDYNNWSRFPQTPAALVERVKKKSPESKPGTHYFYSNSNYHILALIIEKQSGQSYGEFLAKEIFQPLSMSDTAHQATDSAIVQHLVHGYNPARAADFENAPYLDWTSKTSNGSLYSTAEDLLRFQRALQDGKLLRPETLRASYRFDRKDRIPLQPIEADRFFDRSFWSFVRFEKDKLIYRNGDTDYVATRE